MESSTLDWLSRVGSLAFTLSACAFVVVNLVAVAGVLATRDRALVNRWTGRVLAANLVLAGTGLGIPLLASMTRLAVSAVMPGVQRMAPGISGDREQDRSDVPPASARNH
jgi:ABC-type molybdate transport system permease subunit